jgi:hypothetical protein
MGAIVSVAGGRPRGVFGLPSPVAQLAGRGRDRGRSRGAAGSLMLTAIAYLRLIAPTLPSHARDAYHGAEADMRPLKCGSLVTSGWALTPNLTPNGAGRNWTAVDTGPRWAGNLSVKLDVGGRSWTAKPGLLIPWSWVRIPPGSRATAQVPRAPPYAKPSARAPRGPPWPRPRTG